MGYYTLYCISLEDGKEEQYNRMLKDIDALMECSEMSANECIYSDKWYNYEADMESLSRNYPDITVRLKGYGDDRDDVWQTFWHNGRSFTESVRFASYRDIKEQLQ